MLYYMDWMMTRALSHLRGDAPALNHKIINKSRRLLFRIVDYVASRARSNASDRAIGPLFPGDQAQATGMIIWVAKLKTLKDILYII